MLLLLLEYGICGGHRPAGIDNCWVPAVLHAVQCTGPAADFRVLVINFETM
jgi:hypothetical protein